MCCSSVSEYPRITASCLRTVCNRYFTKFKSTWSLPSALCQAANRQCPTAAVSNLQCPTAAVSNLQCPTAAVSNLQPTNIHCSRHTDIFWHVVNQQIHKGKGRGKVHPRTGHEGPEWEQRYRSTLSLNSALDGGGWSTPRPGRFTPGKETRYPLHRRLAGSQGRPGQVRKISPPPPTGIRSSDRPTRSKESLYRLCYPSPPTNTHS